MERQEVEAQATTGVAGLTTHRYMWLAAIYFTSLPRQHTILITRKIHYLEWVLGRYAYLFQPHSLYVWLVTQAYHLPAAISLKEEGEALKLRKKTFKSWE